MQSRLKIRAALIGRRAQVSILDEVGFVFKKLKALRVNEGPYRFVQNRPRTFVAALNSEAGRGIPMKTFAVIFLMVISFSTAQAEIRACVDPPVRLAEKCFKQSGARCDPMTGKWIGGNNQAYKACRSASGAAEGKNGQADRPISRHQGK